MYSHSSHAFIYVNIFVLIHIYIYFYTHDKCGFQGSRKTPLHLMFIHTRMRRSSTVLDVKFFYHVRLLFHYIYYINLYIMLLIINSMLLYNIFIWKIYTQISIKNYETDKKILYFHYDFICIFRQNFKAVLLIIITS